MNIQHFSDFSKIMKLQITFHCVIDINQLPFFTPNYLCVNKFNESKQKQFNFTTKIANTNENVNKKYELS